MKEMKREGEKSREVLLVITVISKIFSERLDWSLLKSSPLTGNPQEDLTERGREIEEQVVTRGKKLEKGERGRGKSWITVTYIHRMKEFWSQSLAVVAVGLFSANLVKIEEKIEGNWRLHIKFIRIINYKFLKKRRDISGKRFEKKRLMKVWRSVYMRSMYLKTYWGKGLNLILKENLSCFCYFLGFFIVFTPRFRVKRIWKPHRSKISNTWSSNILF